MTAKRPEIYPKRPEKTRNNIQGKRGKLEKGGKVIATWNIRDKFGQVGQVRLTEEGKIEKKLCGQRLWRLLAKVDIGIMEARDVQESLKNTEGIVKVTRQGGAK